MSGDESETLEEAVDAFVGDAETVYDEYDQGYLDADAALRRIRTHLDDLEDAAEES